MKPKKKEIKEIITKNDSNINFTTDVWSSLIKDPYLSITSYLIDNEWELNEFLLGVFYFPHPHDASMICDSIEQVIILFLK